MAELIKFHQKNKVLFGKKETTSGTYAAPAGADCLPVLTVDGSVTTETGSYEYLGDSLSRDEYSYIQDQYAEFTAETPQQILGTLNGSLTVANVPLSIWYQVCGGFVTVFGTAQGSFAAGTVFIDNSRVSNETMSVDYRLSTPQDTVNHKLRKFTKCQGTVDVGASLGDVPKLNFQFNGNSEDPIQATILNPVYNQQLVNVSASVQLPTIVRAEIAERDGIYTAFVPAITSITAVENIATLTSGTVHNLGPNGSIRFVRISGANQAAYNDTFMVTITSATTLMFHLSSSPGASATGTLVMTVGPASKGFCFSTLTASNFFGFEFSRYKTGCELGFAKTAVPTDISVSLLEGQAPATTITGITSSGTTATVTANLHGLTVGNKITISEVTGAGATYYNGDFVVATTPPGGNTFTITIASYTGSFSGLARVVNNDFATFDPDSKLSNFFGAQVKFGTGVGKYVTYRWDKLQIRDTSEGTVDSYLGRECAFRNTGRSFIILE